MSKKPVYILYIIVLVIMCFVGIKFISGLTFIADLVFKKSVPPYGQWRSHDPDIYFYIYDPSETVANGKESESIETPTNNSGGYYVIGEERIEISVSYANNRELYIKDNMKIGEKDDILFLGRYSINDDILSLKLFPEWLEKTGYERIIFKRVVD